MHRFFVRPESLGHEKDTYNHWDDPRWRALVDEFRWSIRLRQWKQIDRTLRLFVQVEQWDDGDVLLIANPGCDDLLVDAYIKAGFLEDQAIIVFADDRIPWQRLKPFRAVLRGDPHLNRGAVAERERKRTHKRPKGLSRSGTASLVSSQPKRRSGDPDNVAGGCLMRPKQYEAGLSAKEPSSLCPSLIGRLEAIPSKVTEAKRSRPRLTEKSEGETPRVV